MISSRHGIEVFGIRFRVMGVWAYGQEGLGGAGMDACRSQKTCIEGKTRRGVRAAQL